MRSLRMLVAAVLMAGALSAGARAQDKPAVADIDYSRVAVSLTKLGVPYTVKEKAVWLVPVKSAQGADLTMVVMGTGDIVSFSLPVAEYEKGKTPEGLDEKLADLNNKYLLVKILHDDTGHIYLRIDVLLDSVTAEVVQRSAFVLGKVLEDESKVLTGFPGIKKAVPPAPKPK